MHFRLGGCQLLQKDPEKVAWKVIDNTLLYCKYDKIDSFAADRPRKIAAFDFVCRPP
jgi:bifunctional polynucleotide phosphatase/kinase